jgi:rRNA maturation RNase YbeY
VDSPVSFTDLNQDIPVEVLRPVRRWLNTTVIQEFKSLGEIHYIFCDDEYLHKINVQYLNHDTYTDVITFDYCEGDFISGEIYISTPRARENAMLFSQNFTLELRRLIIHGLLHLLGYKDKNPEDKIEMTAKEDYYLSLLTDK